MAGRRKGVRVDFSSMTEDEKMAEVARVWREDQPLNRKRVPSMSHLSVSVGYADEIL
jgi:hypothetical protein